MRGQYLKKALGNASRALALRAKGLPPAERYWHERAARLGTQADSLVSDFEADAAVYRQVLAEALQSVPWFRGWGRLAIDYGCGTGRFTRLLADAVGGRAIGLEPAAPMLKLAQANADEQISFQRLELGKRPMLSCAADLLGLIHVCGGLTMPEMAELSTNVRHILRPGGVLFVVEAAEGEDSAHWHGRPASWYCKHWSEIPLTVAREVVQSGRRVNIMHGVRTR